MGSYVVNDESVAALNKIGLKSDDAFFTRAVHTFMVKYKPQIIKISLQTAKRLSTNKYMLILKKHSKANSIAWLGRDC